MTLASTAKPSPLTRPASHRFKDLTQEVTVAETAVAINRECRVIRHLVVKIEPTEPPISHVHLDFLAQPPLEADAVAIGDDQHSDHKLGINRRPVGCYLTREIVFGLTP